MPVSGPLQKGVFASSLQGLDISRGITMLKDMAPRDQNLSTCARHRTHCLQGDPAIYLDAELHALGGMTLRARASARARSALMASSTR